MRGNCRRAVLSLWLPLQRFGSFGFWRSETEWPSRGGHVLSTGTKSPSWACSNTQAEEMSLESQADHTGVALLHAARQDKLPDIQKYLKWRVSEPFFFFLIWHAYKILHAYLLFNKIKKICKTWLLLDTRCPAAFTKYTDSVKGLEEMRKGRKTQQKGDDRRGFGDKEKKSHAWKQVRGSQWKTGLEANNKDWGGIKREEKKKRGCERKQELRRNGKKRKARKLRHISASFKKKHPRATSKKLTHV